jgi:hypothetical protein
MTNKTHHLWNDDTEEGLQDMCIQSRLWAEQGASFSLVKPFVLMALQLDA